MSDGHLELDTRDHVEPIAADPGLWEFDLHPPPIRSGVILRRSLLDRMTAAPADVVLVVAPAGYGKTTLLTQFSEFAAGAVAWLTLNQGDNDEKMLLARLAASVTRPGTALPRTLERVSSTADTPLKAIDNGRLITTLSKIEPPLGLVLDNAHVIRSRPSLGVISELVRQLEGRVKVLVASRSEPKLALPALRARGRLLELSEEDLALTEDEVAQVLDGLAWDSGLAANDLTTVTGGWPAAVNLFIAANAIGRTERVTIEDGADHRFLAGFVKQEVLPHLSKSRRDFLKRVSPLERISGPIADAVTGRTGGSKVLDDLATTTHLIYPMEGRGGWYVMNRVLRRVLQAEFEDNDPETAASVHSAAAAWYETNEMPLEAIAHAQRAGDAELFAELLGRIVKSHYAAGHVADILVWMDWLELNSSLAENSQLAAVGALVHAMEGNTLETEKWLDAASRGRKRVDTDAVTWMVRAAATRSGIATMMHDIEMAEQEADPGSEWLPTILLIKGIAYALDGHPDQAEPYLVQACTTGLEKKALAAVVLALGQRGLIAIQRHDWDLASSLTEQALAIIDEYGHDGYHTSGLVLAVAARCARRQGDITKTQNLLARASLVRPRLSAALPGPSVQTLIAVARTYVELSDVVGARALIREADDIVLQRPDLGVLTDELSQLKESLTGLGPGTVGLSALTKAELRLLPLLATNLSFPEIGEQLFISRHTVKTQAMSIYRKLATSSRSDAVRKAYEIGLLHH